MRRSLVTAVLLYALLPLHLWCTTSTVCPMSVTGCYMFCRGRFCPNRLVAFLARDWRTFPLLEFSAIDIVLLVTNSLRPKPGSCGGKNSFCSFCGFSEEEVGLALTRLGVVKSDGEKGEVMHCFLIDDAGVLSFLCLTALQFDLT